MPRAKRRSKSQPGPTTYERGYRDGWNHRAAGDPKVRSNSKKMRGQYGIGYAHGWHDGEGRGQTLAEYQHNPNPPKPKSWERYEKEGLKLQP